MFGIKGLRKKKLIRHGINRVPLWLLVISILIAGCHETEAPSVSSEDQQSPMTFRATCDAEEVTIGDLITCTLRLSRSSQVSAELPEFNEQIEGLSLVQSGRTGPEQQGERVTESRWYEFRAEKVGSVTFPEIQASYILQGEDKEIQTEEIGLEIKSVLPEEMNDIHDIKPLERPGTDRRILFYAVAGLLLVILVGTAFWLNRRKRKGRPEIAPPPLPPRVEAEQALQRLEAMGLIQKGEIKRYYFILSEIYRRYLERRFQVPAVERTAEEILEKLPEWNTEQAVKSEVQVFLANTDPVKFAGWVPEEEEIEAHTQAVKEFLEMTSRESTSEEPEAENVAV